MPIRIVIADDSKLSAKVLKQYISELGYTLVGEAMNGLQAIEVTRETKPDIVILDVFMPQMNGYQACSIIQDELGIPAILITSNTENSSLDDIVKSSPSGVVIKPINKFQLKSTIDLIINDEQHQINLARYRKIVKTAPMMFSLINSSYQYVLVNNYYCTCFERTEEEIVGNTVSQLFGEEVFSTILKHHIDTALAGSPSAFENWFSFPGTGKRFMTVTYSPYAERRGGVANGVVVFSTDSTQLKLSEEKMEILSSTDQLTSLDNRRKFLANLQNEIDRSERYRKVFTLLSIDIDNFKSINDTYGHPVGDKALIYVANTLKASLRKVDHIGRIGGEEFSVILPETDLSTAQYVLNNLISTFNAQIFHCDKINFKITISIGAAGYPDHGGTIDDLLDNADSALYEAKRTGKNRYCFYKAPGGSTLLAQIKH